MSASVLYTYLYKRGCSEHCRAGTAALSMTMTCAALGRQWMRGASPGPMDILCNLDIGGIYQSVYRNFGCKRNVEARYC